MHPASLTGSCERKDTEKSADQAMTLKHMSELPYHPAEWKRHGNVAIHSEDTKLQSIGKLQ